MQKKIIALAVAGLASTAAFAQTNVTVYGVADLGEAYVKSSGAINGDNQKGVTRLDNNSSYIGFKGVEDLGNGLKAVFQFETAVKADDGTIGSGTRDTYVGLAGGFGTVAAGTLTHPLRAFGTKVELIPGSGGFGTTSSITGTIAGRKTLADERVGNAVAYISPSFSGFTGVVAYVNGEKRTNSSPTVASYNRRAYEIAGQYENGPLFVGLGYLKARDFGSVWDSTGGTSGTIPESADGRIIRLAAAYTLPSATKLTALFDSTKVDFDNVAGNQIKRNAFSLGVAQPFGKNTVGLEYAQSQKLKLSGTGLSGVDNSGTEKKMATLLYTYEMSKRTMLHARYSQLVNKDDSAGFGDSSTNFYSNSVANNTTAGTGADYSGIMVGIRHTF